MKIKIKKFIPILMLLILITLVGCKQKAPTEDTTPKELNTNLTDKTTLDLTYEGKIFQKDRIGEVTLASCTDGDTASFKSNGEIIAVRFHAVDTPETKGEIQPWGKPASNFTCDKLTNAKTIVLEGRTVLKDTYGRYLAYVWYDNRLLNLELVEQAYSNAGETSDERYGTLFAQADAYARSTGKRIFGDEKDPLYCYETVETTLEDIRKDTDRFMGCKVVVEGLVTKRIGGDAFIEKDGYGVYLYLNHGKTDRLTIGNLVEVKGSVSEYNGAIQLVGISRTTVTVLSEGNLDQIVPNEITVSEISKTLEGALVKISNLEITESYASSNGALNIEVEDASGNTTMIRIHQSVAYNFDIERFRVGKVVDVTAPIAEYNESFQLMLTDPNDIIIR